MSILVEKRSSLQSPVRGLGSAPLGGVDMDEASILNGINSKGRYRGI